MSIDLMELVREAITPEAVNKLSRMLAETPGGTRKALEGGVPTILAGMAGKSSSDEGISSVLSLFHAGPRDGSILQSYSSLLDGPARTALIDFGNRVIQVVLGENADPVTDAISSQSGVRPTSAYPLLAVAAPLAIGAIRKASGPEGVTIASLRKILSLQKESFARDLPAGLGGILGGAPLAALAQSTTKKPAGPEESPATGPGAGALKRFWPFWTCLAAMVAAGLIWSFNQETAPSQMDAGSGTPGVVVRRKLPDGSELSVPQSGMENRLIDFIESPVADDGEAWFELDGLLFDAESATLQTPSEEQIHNLADILRNYPKVKISIGDSAGTASENATNRSLSRERVRNVMAALVKAGVEPGRMTARGYGDIQYADNSAEDARTRSRGLSLRVTSK